MPFHPKYSKILTVLLFTGIFLTAKISRADELKVLSFNTWLLQTRLGIEISKDYVIRLHAMPAAIAAVKADVILLQEVWSDTAKDHLSSKLAELGYPYSAYRDEGCSHIHWPCRGFMGNGLLIVSRYPITPDSTQQLQFQGFTRADEYLVLKGALRTEIDIPKLGKVDFYNSHLGAITYNEETGEYSAGQMETKTKQTRQFMEFIGYKQNSVQIVAVDLNGHPHQWDSKTKKHTSALSTDYSLMKDELKFVDTTAELSLSDKVFTFDVKNNSYASGGEFKDIPSEWIDFIFINANQTSLKTIKTERVLMEKVKTPDKEVLPSDHYGVMTTFEILTPAK